MSPTTCGMLLDIKTEHLGGRWVTTVEQLNLSLFGATEAEAVGQVDVAVFAFAKNFIIATNDLRFDKLHKFLQGRDIHHDIEAVKARFQA